MSEVKGSVFSGLPVVRCMQKPKERANRKVLSGFRSVMPPKLMRGAHWVGF